MKRIFTAIIAITLASCGQNNSQNKSTTSNPDTVQTVVTDTTTETIDLEKQGFNLMKEESLDKLKLGLKVSDLISALGEPSEKSQNELWEADGEYHQTYKYVKLGIELDLIGEKEAEKTINMITATNPCNYKTNKGISIGSNYTEVEQAYKDFINPEFSDANSLVAGSIYGGLIFNFEAGKVSSISIGASAE